MFQGSVCLPQTFLGWPIVSRSSLDQSSSLQEEIQAFFFYFPCFLLPDPPFIACIYFYYFKYITQLYVQHISVPLFYRLLFGSFILPHTFADLWSSFPFK